MRFIEFKKGKLSINAKDITAIKRVDSKSTEIYTHHASFRVEFPYDTIYQILKRDDLDDNDIAKKMDTLIATQQRFAG